MFEQKRIGVQTFAVPEAKPLALKTPDAHEAMRLAGVRDLTKEELESAEAAQAEGQEEEQDEANASARKRLRACCFCGDRSCRIGPFTQTVEE